jgi:hypothetical protein
MKGSTNARLGQTTPGAEKAREDGKLAPLLVSRGVYGHNF